MRSRARSWSRSPRWPSGWCGRRRRSATAGIPYRVPPRELLEERLVGVLAVLYLIFNEGYSATCGDDLVRGRALRRGDLDDADRATGCCPEQPEVLGLLALMLLQHSRRATRTDGARRAGALEDQDRARWDHAMIDEGLASAGSSDRVARARAPTSCSRRSPRSTRGRPGPRTPTGPRSRASTARLGRHDPVAGGRLNRAVAVSMADGPAAGAARCWMRSDEDLRRIPPVPCGARRCAAPARSAAPRPPRPTATRWRSVTNPAERAFLRAAAPS